MNIILVLFVMSVLIYSYQKIRKLRKEMESYLNITIENAKVLKQREEHIKSLTRSLANTKAELRTLNFSSTSEADTQWMLEVDRSKKRSDSDSFYKRGTQNTSTKRNTRQQYDTDSLPEKMIIAASLFSDNDSNETRNHLHNQSAYETDTNLNYSSSSNSSSSSSSSSFDSSSSSSSSSDSSSSSSSSSD